jgi:hypothetical protein
MRVTGGARLWNPGKLGKELPAVMGNRLAQMNSRLEEYKRIETQSRSDVSQAVFSRFGGDFLSVVET